MLKPDPITGRLRIVRVCRHCSAEFFGSKCKTFCSTECRRAGKRGPWNKGKPGTGGRVRNGEFRKCPVCGVDMYLPPSALATVCCSVKCGSIRRWGGLKTVVRRCKVCGKDIKDYAAKERVVCSKRCNAALKSERHKGERSPRWRGGRMDAYGDDWKRIRDMIVNRDGFACQACGVTTSLAVHHIVPHRQGGTHEASNLITLCRSCHSKAEYRLTEAYVENNRSWSAGSPGTSLA